MAKRLRLFFPIIDQHAANREAKTYKAKETVMLSEVYYKYRYNTLAPEPEALAFMFELGRQWERKYGKDRPPVAPEN